ncbi:hypothetical protein AB0447_36335, partial [Streptomyces sp. NPDC051211]
MDELAGQGLFLSVCGSAVVENGTTGLVLTNRWSCFLLTEAHPPTGEYGVDISVLGALAVRENGVSITPTAPKPRQV